MSLLVRVLGEGRTDLVDSSETWSSIARSDMLAGRRLPEDKHEVMSLVTLCKACLVANFQPALPTTMPVGVLSR